MERKIYQVEEKVPFSLLLPLSLQHTFAMFGASVLVPIVMGIHPGIVLLMNGVGTLFFILITKGKAPAYLGSSFAFLAPAGVIISAWGFEYAQGGFIVTGLFGCILAFIIRKFGTRWIDVVLPPAAMGAVVALIGLELTKITVTGGKIGANIMTETATSNDWIVFLVTLGVAVIGSVLFKKFFATIPILIAMVVGYITAASLGMIDYSALKEASFFTMPVFQLPKFSTETVFTMLPALLVIIAEHISHQSVTSTIVGKDLIKEPGLDKTIFADNFSTMISGFVGGVPTTTYGENIGVMAVTGVYSVQVIGGAAVISILMAFIGPLSAFILTIPGDVIGGVTFLLYGMIGASGIRLLVDKNVDYGKSKNLVLTSVILTTGLSGISVSFAGISLSGMVLSSVVAVVLSLFFYLVDKVSHTA